MRISVHQIRALLAGEDSRYIREDLVSLERARGGEPLSWDNVVLKRLGRLVEVVARAGE